jgi:spore photoproduct lyase
MRNVNEKRKHKNAATKAWKTIRNDKRQKGAEKTEKITKFINPEVMENIRHPETVKSTPKTEELFWKGNRIIVPFDKTPADIACGVFWEIRWAYGCPLNCSYCYLRGTMRGRMNPQYVRTELVLQAIDEAFSKLEQPAIFNSGELADSLMNPIYMEPIVNKFETQNKHKIFLLTKFGTSHIRFLADLPRKQSICGWSINTIEVAKLWEKNAALPTDRINAAALVKDAGYDTRIRIDPIFPIFNWKKHYNELLNEIFSKLKPDRIILGTPRGLWKTIKFAKEANMNMEWAQYFEEDSSWGKKLSFQLRKEIYEFIFDQLRAAGYPVTKISICKETTDMLDSLGIKYCLKTCNCYNHG